VHDRDDLQGDGQCCEWHGGIWIDPKRVIILDLGMPGKTGAVE
jgi:hypothetical protein